MRFLLRITAVLVAVAILGGVVYLGLRSSQDGRFVVWFGIAAAILAPIGFTLIGFAIRQSEAETLERLAKVPEIGRLIEEAKSQQEQIRLLEAERSRLGDIIKLESRRQAIRERIDSLEKDAQRIVSELDSLDREQKSLGQESHDGPASEEIRMLRERLRAREDGDLFLTIGSRDFRIPRNLIASIPLGELYFKLLSSFLRFIQQIRSRKGA